MVVQTAEPKGRATRVNNAKIVYDSHFNANEWFVILGLCIGLLVMFIVPRRFPGKLTAVFFMIGIALGALSDHNVGTVPISLYDTSDTSAFDLADIPAITMYGAYSYLFFYLYDMLKLRTKFIPLYILGWAFVSTGMEWMAKLAGVFHYNYGFWLGISFVIYIGVHSLMVLLYYLMLRAYQIDIQGR